MHNTVVNLGTTVLSLAGVVALPPQKAVVIHLDGFHVGIRTYIDSSLSSSIRAKMVELVKVGTKEECDTAAAHYDATSVKVVVPAAPVVVTSVAAALPAAKVEPAVLPGVFAAGKGSAEHATSQAALVSDNETAAPTAPISAPAEGGVVEIAAAVAPPAPVAEAAPAVVESTEAPVLTGDTATVGQQAGLLRAATSRSRK